MEYDESKKLSLSIDAESVINGYIVKTFRKEAESGADLRELKLCATLVASLALAQLARSL